MSAFTPINIIFVVALAASLVLPFFRQGKVALAAFLFACVVGTLPTVGGELTQWARAGFLVVLCIVFACGFVVDTRSKASVGDRKAAEDSAAAAKTSAGDAAADRTSAGKSWKKVKAASDAVETAKTEAVTAATSVEATMSQLGSMFTVAIQNNNHAAVLKALIELYVVGDSVAGFNTANPVTTVINTLSPDEQGFCVVAMTEVNALAGRAAVANTDTIEKLLNELTP